MPTERRMSRWIFYNEFRFHGDLFLLKKVFRKLLDFSNLSKNEY
ncbi:unnamed protein product [Larinioides sclopetarius]|uniref:Maturase K n=1 Tax=Larinioides sclopetarius TaxID=280406 RepID=A0AAV2A3G8_9ARAC